MTETVFRNGRVVLPDQVIDADVVVRGGVIAAIDDSRSRAFRCRP